MGVQTAAKHWRSSSVTVLEKLVNLEKDVLNAPMHYFGIHDDCESYFCSKETEPEARDHVASLKADGIFDEILNLCESYFASSVPSLLLNYNNNMAESFNNLIAKYTGEYYFTYFIIFTFFEIICVLFTFPRREISIFHRAIEVSHSLIARSNFPTV